METDKEHPNENKQRLLIQTELVRGMESGSAKCEWLKGQQKSGKLDSGKRKTRKVSVDPDGGCRRGEARADLLSIVPRDRISGHAWLSPLAPTLEVGKIRGKNQERCQLLMRSWMCEADSCRGCGLAFWAGCWGLWVRVLFFAVVWSLSLHISSLSKASQCKFVALGSSLHLQSLWFCIWHSFLCPSSHLPFSYPVMFILPLWPHFGCLSQMAIYFRGSRNLTVISPASIILWMRRILRH